MTKAHAQDLSVASRLRQSVNWLVHTLNLRFHRDLPHAERRYLLAMLAFIAAMGVVLYLVTPVPLTSLARGMSLYLMLPFVSVSIVWGAIRLVEWVAGHRIEILHARGQWMLVTATATSAVIPIYGMFKQYVLKAQGFPLDPTLAEIDRLLFFGYDGWQVTHKLFGSVWFTLLLDRAYGLWLPILMFCPVAWAALIKDPFVRARLIGTWVAVWVLVGGVAAWLLASAGPMFYPHFIGPEPSFQALHDEIVALGKTLRAQGEILTTPLGHVYLMNRYFSGIYMPGFGISAMPSVHVSMAALFAIGGFQLNRWIGWGFAAYAVLIWIGSVYLGWHYACDGIVGALLTWSIWKWSARLTNLPQPPAPR